MRIYFPEKKKTKQHQKLCCTSFPIRSAKYYFPYSNYNKKQSSSCVCCGQLNKEVIFFSHLENILTFSHLTISMCSSRISPHIVAQRHKKKHSIFSACVFIYFHLVKTFDLKKILRIVTTIHRPGIWLCSLVLC